MDRRRMITFQAKASEDRKCLDKDTCLGRDYVMSKRENFEPMSKKRFGKGPRKLTNGVN